LRSNSSRADSPHIDLTQGHWRPFRDCDRWHSAQVPVPLGAGDRADDPGPQLATRPVSRSPLICHPFTPMRWMHINESACPCFNPASVSPAAWKLKHSKAISVLRLPRPASDRGCSGSHRRNNGMPHVRLFEGGRRFRIDLAQ